MSLIMGRVMYYKLELLGEAADILKDHVYIMQFLQARMLYISENFNSLSFQLGQQHDNEEVLDISENLLLYVFNTEFSLCVV